MKTLKWSDVEIYSLKNIKVENKNINFMFS